MFSSKLIALFLRWIAAACFFFICGIVLYGYVAGLIQIRQPWSNQLTSSSLSMSVMRKITFFFSVSGRWRQEEVEMIWSAEPAEAIAALVGRWFALAEQEGYVQQRVLVQSCACIGQGQSAYVSLDCCPFWQDDAIFAKLMIIEGILKTVSAAGCAVSGIQFLVHHQILIDSHLDFSYPWPLIGFTQD